MRYLLAQAVFAFLVMPGIVAFLIPLAYLRPSNQSPRADGLVLLCIGAFFLLWCVRDFYVSGKGTLAPWAPPATLVTTGLYRFSRNPMYVAVLLILWGWAVGFRSRPLANYAVLVMFLFYVRVIVFEEPYLARTHGDEWVRYKAQVHRWFGRRRSAHDLHQPMTG